MNKNFTKEMFRQLIVQDRKPEIDFTKAAIESILGVAKLITMQNMQEKHRQKVLSFKSNKAHYKTKAKFK